MSLTIQLPKMYKWQQDVFFNVKQHWKDSIHVIKSKRQVGKSILCEIIMLYTALASNKQRCYILEPSFAQCDKMLNELKDMVQGKPFYKGMNNIRRQIFFKNGSEIRLFSAEQGDENLRGFTSELLIIDEAAFISTDIINAVLPYVNVSKGPILLFSTPRSKSGLFYDYYCMGSSFEPNNCYSYDWAEYDTSELLSPVKLELYRRTMDQLAFKTDYLGQFLDNESRFFGVYQQCVYNKPFYGDVRLQPVYVGIDWGSGVGSDYTAVTVIDRNNNLIDLLYFNDKDPNQTIESIYMFLNKFNVQSVTVEMNSIGTVYYGLLAKRLKDIGSKVRINKFYTTNDSKDKIISNLQVQIQNNNVKFFNDEELFNELDHYEMEFSKTGKRVFNAEQGWHDDVLMSLAMALASINKGEYKIGFA